MIDKSKGKIVNHHQICGIETSIADNGAAKGSRFAWVNTGSPLRFKVAIDRGLDIVDAFYNNYSLAWLSHNGLTAPRPDCSRDAEWLSNFPGGLVTTCGLRHIGAPEEGQSLHGRYSNLPAELESVIQPDIYSQKPEMKISGTIRESSLFSCNLELKRTISCKAGEPVIKISDTVCNLGNTASPLMLLYHCNLGWQLVDEGAKIFYTGKATSRGTAQDDFIFNENSDCKTCRAPIPEHDGSGEACGFIDPQPDKDGFCTAGVRNEKIGISLSIKFQKQQLPCLTNWQHWGRGEYVTGIEPGTNFPIGQKAAQQSDRLQIIEPGETKNFGIEISVNAL